MGHKDEARKAADRIAKSLPFTWPGIVAYVHAAIGDREFATRFARRVEAMPSRPWGAETSLAWALLGLGDSTHALAALERALDAREMWPSNFSLLEPIYDIVRHSPRFAALIRRVGLDPRMFVAPRSGQAR